MKKINANTAKGNKSIIDARFEKVGAEEAKELLHRNIRNRDIDAKQVNKYVEIMKRGEWQMNGDPIHISEGGVLLNGQHRLTAIMQSGVEQTLLIVRNVPDTAMTTYDRGKNRSVADIMSLEGVEKSKYIAAIVKSYITLQKGNAIAMKEGTASGSSNRVLGLLDTDFTSVYKEHPELFQSVLKHGLRIQKKLRGMLTASEMGAYMAYLIIDKQHPEEKVVDFFEKLHDMQDVSVAVIGLLREKLIQSKMGNLKLTGVAKKGLIVKAWNAYVSGKDLKRLVFGSGDVVGEVI